MQTGWPLLSDLYKHQGQRFQEAWQGKHTTLTIEHTSLLAPNMYEFLWIPHSLSVFVFIPFIAC